MGHTLFNEGIDSAINYVTGGFSKDSGKVQLHITCDADAKVFCDGTQLCAVRKNSSEIAYTTLGHHNIVFTSSVNPQIVKEINVDYLQSGAREIVDGTGLASKIDEYWKTRKRQEVLKKLRPIFVAVAVVVIIVGTIVLLATRPRLSVKGFDETVHLSSIGNASFFSVRTNREYEVNTNVDWLKIEKNENGITLFPQKNTTGVIRYADISFSYVGKEHTLRMSQPTVGSYYKPSQDNIILPAESGKQRISFDTDASTVEVSSVEEWLSSKITNNYIELCWRNNESNVERTANLYIVADDISCTIAVSQKVPVQSKMEEALGQISGAIDNAIGTIETSLDAALSSNAYEKTDAHGLETSMPDEDPSHQQPIDWKSVKFRVSEVSCDEYAIENGVRGIQFNFTLKQSVVPNREVYIAIPLFSAEKQQFPVVDEDYSYRSQCAIYGTIMLDDKTLEVSTFIPFRSMPRMPDFPDNLEAKIFGPLKLFSYAINFRVILLDENGSLIYQSDMQNVKFGKLSDYNTIYY